MNRHWSTTKDLWKLRRKSKVRMTSTAPQRLATLLQFSTSKETTNRLCSIINDVWQSKKESKARTPSFALWHFTTYLLFTKLLNKVNWRKVLLKEVTRLALKYWASNTLEQKKGPNDGNNCVDSWWYKKKNWFWNILIIYQSFIIIDSSA
jgi:hypothetical protein